MSTSASGKSVEEISKLQAEYAKKGHWMASYVDDAILEVISKDETIDFSNLLTAGGIIRALRTLVTFEIAYGLVECSALNFTLEARRSARPETTSALGTLQVNQATFCFGAAAPVASQPQQDSTKVGEQLLFIPEYCRHHYACVVRVYGTNNSLETACHVTATGSMKPYNGFEEPSSDTRKFCQMWPASALYLSPLQNLKDALDNLPCTVEGRHFDIVGFMFDFNLRKLIDQRDDDPEIAVSEEGLDALQTHCLGKIVNARKSSKMKALLPFIMRQSVWTDQPLWLKYLVTNLNKIRWVKIGILLPSSKIREAIAKRLEQSELLTLFVAGSDTTCTELDYLIIYRAHSISVTEGIEWMSKVKPGGMSILIGDPNMPNLRIRSLQVRDACASVLDWFYNRERYPEYFEENGPYSADNLLCIGYSTHIFKFFNDSFYNGELINPLEFNSDPIETRSVVFKHVNGSAVMLGCSPYNEAERNHCLEAIDTLVKMGIKQDRIGVLTTYCAQKKKIILSCSKLYAEVLVGTLNDFEYVMRDYLIISTVETAERTVGGKRYLFSDLLYDRLCLNLAVTRARYQIIIIGDKKVLSKINHWSRLLLQSFKFQDDQPF